MSQRTALFLVLFLATIAAAQTNSATVPEDKSLPRIVKQTQLVFVPVVVEGKHGEILRGLTKDSFVVEQDGKPRNIAIFEEVKSAGTFSDRAPAFAPGMVENFALNDAQARKTIIIILDTLNSPFLDQARAKKALVDFVRKSLQPDQPVALMVLSPKGLHQVHSITADPKVLLETVKLVQSQYGRSAKDPDPLGMKDQAASNSMKLDSLSEIRRDPETEAARMTEYLNEVENSYFQRQAALTTIEALEQLAGCFAGIPGRKSVIWATAGFPFDIQDPHSFNGLDGELYSSYERTWKRLNDANLAIYPVDISGLQVGNISPIRTQNSANPMGRRGMSMAFDQQHEQQATLQAFASATGGKAFLNSNDIAGSFAKAADETDAYYLLGYYLHTGEEKEGWHKLKVRVKGSHGDVRARDGFFIGGTKSTEKSRLKELTVALSAPADYTGVHFGVLLSPSAQLTTVSDKTSNEKRVQRLHISFAPGALSVDPDNNNQVTADFAVIAIEKDKVIGETLRSVHYNLTPADVQRLTHSGLGFEDTLVVPSGDYEVRVAVRDLNSGKIGTLRTHLVVP